MDGWTTVPTNDLEYIAQRLQVNDDVHRVCSRELVEMRSIQGPALDA